MIMLGLSLMTLLVCIVGILGTLGQYTVRQNAEQMLKKDIPALSHLNQTLALGLSMKDFANEINVEEAIQETQQSDAESEAEAATESANSNNAVTNIQTNNLKAEQIEKVNDTYKQLLDSLTAYTNTTTDYPKAEELTTNVKNAATSLFVASRYAIQTPNPSTLAKLTADEKAFSTSLSSLNNFSSTIFADKGNKNIRTANRVGLAILLTTLLGAFLSWLISTLLWRNIFGKVNKLQEATELVQDGKTLIASEEPMLSLLSSNNSSNVFGVLANSLMDMSSSVNQKTNDLILNCDRIDKVKDSYGSVVSNRLCQEIAIRIGKNIKNEDFVVHLNQDEYAILLEPIESQDEVLDVAKRIMNSLTLPFEVDDHIIDVTGHLGIVFADHSYSTIDAVMNDAEMAMQKAKIAGPGRWKVFKTSIKNDHELKVQLVEDLRNAIENDGLELYYQSIIDLKKRTIDGFEALVRWKHPERGQIFPDTFIPIAEENDLIYDLDLFVLRKASEQIKIWNMQFGNEHKVNINMSSQSLVHGQLLNDFDRLVEAYNLNPAFLSLDINENFLVENTKYARSVLQKLRSMGVSIILDDFGTGYSAISNLQNSQVDEVKIDRSFIQDIQNKEERLNVVRTIVTLAQNMKLQVTAEGVESKAQLYLLEELGCNHAQGYLFTKPKDVNDIEKMLEKQRVRRAKAASSPTAGASKPKAVPPTAAQPQAVQPQAVQSQVTTNTIQATSSEKQVQVKQEPKVTDTIIEEVQIQHPVNQTRSPETTPGAPKTLLLADSNLRQTMYDESPA